MKMEFPNWKNNFLTQNTSTYNEGEHIITYNKNVYYGEHKYPKTNGDKKKEQNDTIHIFAFIENII